MFATKWYQHQKAYRSATNIKDEMRYLSAARRDRQTTRNLLRMLDLSQVEYVIWPYFVHGYVSLKSYKSKSLKCFIHSNHFCLALIHFPRNLDGKYIVYCFDSMGQEMDEEVRCVFALLLMEHEHCDDIDATGGAFDQNSVDEFMATRMRFTHVKVCRVFAQSLVSAYPFHSN